MKIKNLVYFGLASILLWSCSSQSDNGKDKIAGDVSVQQESGLVSLRLASASYYQDVTDPSNNTAEWNVFISKPGGYKVWLSSATTDTVNLGYLNSVKVDLPDNLFEVVPACDKIMKDPDDVSYPSYRADSYAGSVYFNEPGEYKIQVISDKVMPKESVNQKKSMAERSKLMAVILSPTTR